ncbi:MAG: DUF4058 family protein [Verrucomicrobiales bacterium]
MALVQRKDQTGFGTNAGTAAMSPTAVDIAVLEPVAIVISEPTTESFVEIREKGGGKLITVIEFISPSNTLPGQGHGSIFCGCVDSNRDLSCIEKCPTAMPVAATSNVLSYFLRSNA